jgi:23S rRNA (pseudouridine1915-N3)-methyltransferase
VRIAIVAVGRLKGGSERELVERYRERFQALGRAHGFSSLEIVEIPESRERRDDDRRTDEGRALLDRVGGARLVALDERGQSLGSRDFADRLARWRDEGTVAFAIGGADGLDSAVRDRADLVLSLGALTLPHQLVRVVLIEQLYRGLTILSGHPYHRGA